MTAQQQQSLKLEHELERQERYLSALPDDFAFPLFNTKHALESQRRNGYRHTASAAREIVDNAVEAGATEVRVIFDRVKNRKGREVVTAVAFIDNGSGMKPRMARYALTWGGGTHFEDKDADFIGRFGFGLPNASINQTRRVEVYTRTDNATLATRAVLDITHVQAHGLQTVPPPDTAELPSFVAQYLERNKLTFERGTVVVWQKPDRLTYNTVALLKEHLLDDFGVTYRYLLDRFSLLVENVPVEMVDPLFLEPKGRYYVDPEKGGARQTAERTLAVKYHRDAETGADSLSWLRDPAELATVEPNEKVGTIYFRVSRLPYGFAARGAKASDEFSPRRLDIRKTRRGISFVRAGREIETVDAFPKTKEKESKGLGKWPLLQSYAYHWGVEVRFDPALDEVFGITNDKQTVRPIEDFWRLVASEDVELDRILLDENEWQRQERVMDKPQAETSEAPSPAEQAATMADSIAGKQALPAGKSDLEVEREIKEEAEKRAASESKPVDEIIPVIEAESKRRRYKIEYYDDAHGPFFEPKVGLGRQIVVRINRKHPFYDSVYADLLSLPGGARAKEGIDVVLIALAKGELTMDDELAREWYRHQREREWSDFLKNALKVLMQTFQASGEEREEVTV